MPGAGWAEAVMFKRLFIAAALAWATGIAPAQDEVPFITTPDQVTLAMLSLAGVVAGDHVIDLGSGDGRLVITAAKRHGASGLGVEIVPDLVQKSRDLARIAGVQDRVEFREQDLFQTDLARASVVTMYLLPEVNLQLRPRLLALAPGTRIVSHDWDMGDWAPDRSLSLEVPEKAIGREKRSTVHLWVVPARVQGLWCSDGGRLEIEQRFQAFSATLTTSTSTSTSTGTGIAPLLVVDGRIDGLTLHAQGLRAVLMMAQAGTLKMGELFGPATGFSGRTFVPAQGLSCPG